MLAVALGRSRIEIRNIIVAVAQKGQDFATEREQKATIARSSSKPKVHLCPGSARRGLSDHKENGTAKHAEHAKGGGALQVQDDAFDLKARLAEVEQQAEMQARGFQIIQALRAMNVVDPLGYFQFDEDDVVDE
jgi:hypothetical protein